MKINKILNLAFVFLALFIFGNLANASVYVTPEVTGVIANSMYKPNVTYPEWSTISGNYLYYSSNWDNTFTIVDISDPMNLVEKSTLHDGDTGATIKSPKGVMVVGDYAYFINWDNATGNESVEILNVADKSNPYHVGNYIYTLGTGDKTYSLFVEGDYIYIATSAGNKFIILDATDKSNILLASSITRGTYGTLLNVPYGVAVSGNYAFVTSYSSDSLEVFDITDKNNPVYISYLVNGTGGAKLDGAAAIQISGNYAYIMSRNSKALEIVNISNPASPTHAGQITNGTDGSNIWGYELVINGNYAYLSSYDGAAIEVVNISNPASPTHVGLISNGDGGAALQRPRAISYYNDTLYISVTGSNRMEVIDVTNPATPTHINKIDPSIYLGGPRLVKIHNGLAYVTTNIHNSLQIIDVSNKSNPTPRGAIALDYSGAQLYSPLGIDFRGNYAYIVSTGANFGSGGTNATWGALEIVDISNPDNPVHVNSIVGGIFAGVLTGGAQNIKIVGDYAYITAASKNSLLILDIGTDPINPTLVGSLANGSGGASLVTPFGVDVVGDYAYITTSNALEIVNISSSTNPVHASVLANGSGGAALSAAKYIEVVGNYAYIVSSGSNALEIVDVSNPLNPTHAGSLANGSGGALLAGAYGLSVFEDRAYVGSMTSNALEIIDISNPASPSHLYSITDGTDGARLISARGVDNDGEYVYVVAYNGSSNALNIVRIKAVMPENLVYSSPEIYTKGITINSLIPTVTGSDLIYSISPALPAGLTISSSTGIISGTPNVATGPVNYIVTATNSAGSTNAQLTITVNKQNSAPVFLPPSVGFGSSEVSIPMNAVQTINPISNSGINVLAYIGSQAEFKVPESKNNWNLKNHSLKITDLDLYRNIITITLSSKPQTISLKKGENKEVDLDGDYKNDILVSFVDIYVNRAEITIKSLEKSVSTTDSIFEQAPKIISAPTPVKNLVEKKNNFTFSSNLKINSFSSDVKELQKYLNANGYMVANQGAGSLGKETNFFGPATKAALIKFQKAKNINPAIGIFGPITRKVINEK
jgi:hypothetical protein